jgi:DNA-binding beta-propeller fold protein YncE
MTPRPMQRGAKRSRARWICAVACALAVPFAAAPAAHASDRIYWGNNGGTRDTIGYTNLDGSGAGHLPTGSATVNGPMGLAIDSSTGKLYWVNWADGLGDTISWAYLDGSGGGDLYTGAAIVSGPHGAAIDPVTKRIYWPNDGAVQSISWANLDGSGGGTLDPGAATINGPRGLSIDPTARRIYWANNDGNKLSWANLDGSGGADLNPGSATVNSPEGVALDRGAGKLYFANFSTADKISYIKLDGSGGGDLPITGATVDNPHGLALDVAADKVYWPNYLFGTIAYANLDGSGGGQVDTTGAPIDGPDLPSLLKAPVAAGAPQVRGSAKPGSTLRCRPNFGDDLFEQQLYRAPESYSYRWSVNGKPIPGAATGSIRGGSVGDYACTVTGTNPAGSETETSGPRALFKVHRPRLDRAHGTADLAVTVPGAGRLRLTGKGVSWHLLHRVAAVSRKAGKHTLRARIKAKGHWRRQLVHTGKTRLRIDVTYTPAGGESDDQVKKLRLVEH